MFDTVSLHHLMEDLAARHANEPTYETHQYPRRFKKQSLFSYDSFASPDPELTGAPLSGPVMGAAALI